MFSGAILIGATAISTGFISSWNTANTSSGSSTSTQVKIPTISTGTYDCTVHWGDGTISKITTYNDPALTHTYGSSGTYTITIYGQFNGIAFTNAGDRLKLLTISQWGSNFGIGNGSSGQHFHGCANLTITATDILNLNGTTALSNTFNGCSAITTIPSINSWNFSAITTMNTCFGSCVLFNQSLNLNTSSVTDYTSCFTNCSVLNSTITLMTQSATTFSGMFATCSLLNSAINFSSTALVTTMTNMFHNCTAFKQDISGFSIAALTSAATMFLGVTLSNATYNKLLATWGAFVTPNHTVTFSGGSSHYDATSGGYNGTAGRLLLTGTYGWVITDSGTP